MSAHPPNPPQSTVTPVAVQTLTFLSAINLPGMKARCSLCLRHAKNPGKTWSHRRLVFGTSLREDGDETICIGKQQLRPTFLLVLRLCATYLACSHLHRHWVAALLSSRKISATGLQTPPLDPCLCNIVPRNLPHVRHCGNLFANFPLDQDTLEGQADQEEGCNLFPGSDLEGQK